MNACVNEAAITRFKFPRGLHTLPLIQNNSTGYKRHGDVWRGSGGTDTRHFGGPTLGQHVIRFNQWPLVIQRHFCPVTQTLAQCCRSNQSFCPLAHDPLKLCFYFTNYFVMIRMYLSALTFWIIARVEILQLLVLYRLHGEQY